MKTPNQEYFENKRSLIVSDDTHKKIMQLKYDGEFSSVDDVIKLLLERNIHES